MSKAGRPGCWDKSRRGTRIPSRRSSKCARVRKTVDFARSVPDARFADAENQKIRLSWAPGKFLGGKDYLLQMVIPNVYFHIAMAYAVLGQSGVDVGKMDFLGQVRFQDA